MAVVHPRLTRAEFERLFADGSDEPRFELVEGQVVMVPPAGGLHAYTQSALFGALHGWQRETGDGGLVLGEFGMPAGERGSVSPDVAYWTAGRRPRLGRGPVEVVPDLVVEVLSPSNAANDRGPKRAAYLEAGVREQWLIDPETGETIIVDADGSDRRLDADHFLCSALLPGFEAPIRELLVR